MTQKLNQLISQAQVNARLQQWRKRHNTPAKVSASHRKVLLDRVVESMAFDGQPISMVRLKVLLKQRKRRSEGR
jgi:hypothetical protein